MGGRSGGNRRRVQPASGLRSDFVGGLQPSPQSFEAGGGREDLTLTAVEADRLPRRLSGGGILHAAESRSAVEARLLACSGASERTYGRGVLLPFRGSISHVASVRRASEGRPLPPLSLSCAQRKLLNLLAHFLRCRLSLCGWLIILHSNCQVTTTSAPPPSRPPAIWITCCPRRLIRPCAMRPSALAQRRAPARSWTSGA